MTEQLAYVPHALVEGGAEFQEFDWLRIVLCTLKNANTIYNRSEQIASHTEGPVPHTQD